MLDVSASFDETEIMKYREEVLEKMSMIIHDLADEIFAISQRKVPVDKGTLKKSGSTIHGKGYSWIGYNTPYAKPVHDGFDTHVQRVRAHNRVMRTTGVVIRVRSHERLMPARSGVKYLDDAIDEVLRKQPREVRDSIEIIRADREV